MSNTEIVTESLNELAKMDEMDGWLENMSEMMVRQDERAAEAKLEKVKRQSRIDQEVSKATLKYGRVMTPSQKNKHGGAAAAGSKREGIVDR